MAILFVYIVYQRPTSNRMTLQSFQRFANITPKQLFYLIVSIELKNKFFIWKFYYDCQFAVRFMPDVSDTKFVINLGLAKSLFVLSEA